MYSKTKNLPTCNVVRNININWKLLKKLLSYRTHSRNVKARIEFSEFLGKWINSNINNAVIEEDSVGNIYITKGIADIYPCLVAHLDINQAVVDDVCIMQTPKIMFGINQETGEQCGLGFDDKAGIYLALHCLKKFDAVKCFFPIDEEIGGVGSHAADLTFFENVSFLLQGDRNSWSNDVSVSTNGETVVSEEFMVESFEVLDKYNYNYEACMYTDIGILAPALGICGVNISIGYVNEHFDTEILMIKQFINAIAFAEDLITKMNTQIWENDYKTEYPVFDDTYFADHYSSGYKFQKEDEWWVQDCLSTGECPTCMSTNLEDLKNGMTVCNSCESYYTKKPKNKKQWV